MGELFRRKLPAQALQWTGERLVTEVSGPIESEHLHRYFVARELCRGKAVLDVASGEGYGTALLAQTAGSAIGVELDQESVNHALLSYQSPNLKYLQGDAMRLPVADSSVDVVVSFETLEHLECQERFISEVLRVLRPGGLLVISTPDSNVYSAAGVEPNPYHVHELTAAEFSKLLTGAFKNVELSYQRAFAGSAIWPEKSGCLGATWFYDQRSADTFELHEHLPRAPYLIAMASNGTLPRHFASLLDRQEKVDTAVDAELERLRNVESAIPQLETEIARLREVEGTVPKLAAEISRLESIVAAYRKQDPITIEQLAGTQRTADAARQESLVLSKKISTLQAEHHRALEEVNRKLRDVTEQAESYRQQFDAATLMIRQQTLVSQRLQAELVSQRQRINEEIRTELASANARADHYEKISQELSRLIFPVWMRRVIPPGLRPAMRAIKKAIRP